MSLVLVHSHPRIMDALLRLGFTRHRPPIDIVTDGRVLWPNRQL